HGSAMTLWGFWKRWDLPFEVATRTARRRKGIRVHRCATLTRRDAKTQLGIRVTSPARTLLDIAPRLTDRQLTRVVNDARFSTHLRLEHLRELLERCPVHRSARRLRPFLEGPENPTRSGNEDDFAGGAAAFDLPRALINVPIGGRVVDAVFEKEKVIVEIDDYGTHSSKTSFESDRDRDADHLELGFVTVRITKERMRQTPAREAERL